MKNSNEAVKFAAGDFVVYPTHGVGRVTDVAKHNVGGNELELLVVKFDKDRMTLRVPLAKLERSGLRKLSNNQMMDDALEVLKGKSKAKKTMWSRRAQEYEAKINSGEPISIAEVVRDLHRTENLAEQSYSERQIYEQALERLANELAALENIGLDKATAKLVKILG